MRILAIHSSDSLMPILYISQKAMLSVSSLLNPISQSLLPQSSIFHGTCLSFKAFPTPILSVAHVPNSNLSANSAPEDEHEDFRVLTATRSQYNNITILESETSKVLLLDDSCNVHSILYKDQIWTNSYWDEFTSLPTVIPQGPVAVFGLGGGTVAHQLLHFWPSLCIHGWELDEILVDRARQFFGLDDLEIRNEYGGVLNVHVGDALSDLTIVEGGYAGIIVDLFSNAKVLTELENADTWLKMREKLMPDGRIMVNCGGEISLVESGWEVNLTIQAMCDAFGRKLVNWKKMSLNESGNYLAFTGPLPELDKWSNAVPQKLGRSVALWRSCEP